MIVGGTDGSGTRGAVTFLLSSGVLMLNDAGGAGDCQYDVHGKELHSAGWPPVVQRVLKESHAADYDPAADLSDRTRRETEAALRTMAARFRKRVEREAGLSGNKGGGGFTRWGFKAPVTMYMVPFWAEVFPGATFLHVVRDGRDMSFHWLQSPVRRYWPHLFPTAFAALPRGEQHEKGLIPERGSYIGRAYLYDEKGQRGGLNMRPHFRIAELWAEANLQTEAAGRRLARAPTKGSSSSSSSSSSTPPAIRFLTVRSEDFVTTRERYFGASTALLQAVSLRPIGAAAPPGGGGGGGMSVRDMCCLVASHWAAEQNSKGWAKNVQNYGKWRGAVKAHGGEASAGDPSSLYGGILARAGPALAHFGYTGAAAAAAAAWNYSAVGAVDCAAALAEPCPAPLNVHKQKCM